MLLEPCSNPLCSSKIDGSRSRGIRRRFCNAECKLHFWVLKKAARLLAPIENRRVCEILARLSREDQPAAATALEAGRLGQTRELANRNGGAQEHEMAPPP